jgi:diaminopimelate decarboxylase
VEPFIEALDNILALVDRLAKEGIIIEKINMGGGLGIPYQPDISPPSPAELVQALLKRLEGRSITLSLEPGRSIVAAAGVLITQVEYVKKGDHKNFVIVDAGMNDLMRPALYDAWQEIVPVQQRNESPTLLCDVVGPVCESADFLGKNRALAVQASDYLVVKDAGAYGFVMSSQYNSRPRAAEVLLTDKGPELIRERETYEDLWDKERLL